MKNWVRNKYICTFVLVMFIISTVLPTAVFAEDEIAMEQSLFEATQSEMTTESAIQYKNAEKQETVYQVSSETDFSAALKNIQSSTTTGAMIVLTRDIRLTSSFCGIAGKRITLKSDGDANYLLTMRETTLSMEGPIEFEQIYISADTIYANGNPLILGDGFGSGENGQTRMIVYGGSDTDLIADTSITIKDGVYKLIAGGNSSGTLTGDTHIDFMGGTFPTAADGKDTKTETTAGSNANYNILFKMTWPEQGAMPYGIYGGGIDSNTVGNTHITVTDGTVFQIFGGGAVRTQATAADQSRQENQGRVSGDTNVTVSGGTVRSVYGGGFNSISCTTLKNPNNPDGDGIPFESEWRLNRAAVDGTANVAITGSAKVLSCERDESNSSSTDVFPGVFGGSFHASVGSTHVKISGKAVLENGGPKYGYGVAYGGGYNDIVRNTSYIEVSENANLGNGKNRCQPVITMEQHSLVTPLGTSSASKSFIGGTEYAYGSEIRGEQKLEIEGKEYAAIAKVSGGTVDALAGRVHHNITSRDKSPKTVTGNMLLWQTGGTLKSIEGGCPSNQQVALNGDIDALIEGGTVSSYITGKYPFDTAHDDGTSGNTITGTSNLFFRHCGSEANFVKSATLISWENVLVADDSNVAVLATFNKSSHDSKKAPFFEEEKSQVGNLVIEKGSTLALVDDAKINGNLILNGALHLGYSGTKIGSMEIGAKPKTLTAAGTANGTGDLRTIAPPKTGADYTVSKTPKQGDECIYAKQTGSTMVLDLTNPEEHLGIGRKEKKTDQDVWYIEKFCKVVFNPQGGIWDNDVTDTQNKEVKVVAGKTVTAPTASLTKENYEFIGWYTVPTANLTKENHRLASRYTSETDGDLYNFDSPVNQDITLYAHWTPKQTPIGPIMASYQVEHYQEQLDGSYKRVDADTERLFEKIGVTVTATPQSYAFYHVNEAAAGTMLSGMVVQPTANADGTPQILTLRIYYDLDMHTVQYDLNGGKGVGALDYAEESVKHGVSVTVKAAPIRDGYTFTGWKVDNTIYQQGDTFAALHDVILVAQWTPKQTPIGPIMASYQVEHYQEQLDGSYKRVDADTERLFEKIGVTVTATPQSYAFYHVNEAAAGTMLSGMVVQPTANADGTPQILMLRVYYDLDTHTVQYDLNGGKGVGALDYAEGSVKHGASVTVKAAPIRDGYTFTGWKVDNTIYQQGDTFAVLHDVILVAQWKEETSKPSKPSTPSGGSSGGSSVIVPELNKEDHFAYMVGYPEGDFLPERNMTRAEVTVMFSRLMRKEMTVGHAYSNSFSDVNAGEWYYNAIGYMEQFGIVKGYPDGTFRPDAPVTRAEFAAIASRFDALKETAKTNFSDLPADHWAKGSIELAYKKGWIGGYPDGTVRPDQNITRAEVVTVTNRMLERSGDADYINTHQAEVRRYVDLNNSHWAYYNIMEASNGHFYQKVNKEKWTGLKSR